MGASFEGFAIEQVIQKLQAEPEQCYSWGLHSGASLDRLVVRGGTRRGFEVKYTSAPSVTRSMRSAVDVLGLDQLDVIYPGRDTFPLTDRIRAVGIERWGVSDGSE